MAPSVPFLNRALGNTSRGLLFAFSSPAPLEKKKVDKARLPMPALFVMAKANPSRERLPKGTVFWQVVIDKDLHRQFKARCVEIGKSMSEQAEELVRVWVRKKK